MSEYRHVRYHQLYRFCSKNDFILLAIGLFLAIVTGFCQPVTFYAFGQLTAAMIENAKNSSCSVLEGGANFTRSTTTLMGEAETFVLFNIGVGLTQFILGYIMVLCFNLVAENQVFRIRVEFFQNLIRQNIGFFDTEGKREFSGRIIEDMLKIQESMSEKLGACVFLIVNFVALTVQSFYTGWKLAIVLTLVVPVISTITWFQSSINSKLTAKELSAYSTAGSIAEEVLGNIKTVSAFNGAKLELSRYEMALENAKRFSYRKNFLLGFSNALNWLFCFLNYSLAFYYGTLLVIESRESGDGLYGPNNLVVVFFGVLVAAYNIGQTMEYFEVFSAGTGAAREIFRILDKVSEIDSLGDKGLKPNGRSSGEILFEEVEFTYPSRKSSLPILNKFSLSISPGQTVALVGKSGCGKSTCLSLLQRFYDPTGGRILVDGIDCRKLNLGWLRSQIGVVSQEPKLFNDSIYKNIVLGQVGCGDKEVLQAARDAFAHDFISALPNGYFTPCGESGVELSGGEKQRIAIARSLVRNPPILLFDEATSALDFYSEAVVQAALERARQGRTTIIIAHRLSTIRAADLIVVMDNGEVKEQGTHEVLMTKRGHYYGLVVTQEQNLEAQDLLEVVKNNFPPHPSQRTEFDFNVLIKNSQALDLIFPTSAHPTAKLKSYTQKLEKERKALLANFQLRRFMSFLEVKEWAFLLIAILCTLIKSVNIPLYCWVFGKFIVLFALNDNTEILERGSNYAVMFLCIGFATGLSSFCQKFFAGLAGDSISRRVRKVCFAHMLRQDLTFFSEPGNTVGKLTARLSTDAAGIQGATSSRLVGLFQAVAIILFSVGVSIFLIPKMGLVVSLFVPLSVAGAFLEGKVLSTANVAGKEAIERSAAIAVEALSSIRTVASFGLERGFIAAYKDSLNESHVINKRRAHIRALIFGFVYGIPYFGYSLSLWYGAYLMESECANVAYIFMVAEALIYGIGSAGSALAYAPDYENGKISSGRIFRMLDRKPLIDSSATVGRKLTSVGSVSLNQVTFSYQSRKEVKVLANASLNIRSGERVGLVGTSGSGKSTLVGLLLRFYDPITGTVNFDDKDLRSLNLHSLRSQISIVQQEPILFDRTIAENISYGDTDSDIGMDQVIAAAKLARIHDFIIALPSVNKGYETRVGAMGNQISGGEKQRIAIARSIIRNPKLLILDEATSALDSDSERSVQEALDELQNVTSGSLTVLTISHRLTSLRNCSKIMVLVDGRVGEEGTHADLLDRKGAYYRLWSSQTQLNVTKGKDLLM